MNKYKALIIDDEINNVAILEYFISQFCLNIKTIGHALTVTDAVSKIDTEKPDIIFLDIRLDEGDAFDILDRLKKPIRSQIIFVTSYDEYAVKAFKYNAIAYILKPIAIDDMVLATNKAIKNIEQGRYFDIQKMEALNNSFKSKLPENSSYIGLASIDKIDILKAEEVLYIEADRRYSHFYMKDGKKHTTSKNLMYFEEVIDNNRFFRIHNSYIINMEYVVKVIKTTGSYCEMINGDLLPISKRRLDDFSKFLNIKK